MAKAKISTEAKETETLLQGLRNALDGQVHLFRGTPAAGGLFPVAKTADAVAQKALDSRFLEATAAPAGAKPKQKFARLSDKGRQFVLAHDPQQKLLETLLPIVQQLAGRLNDLTDALQQTTALIQAALRPPSTPAAPAPTPPAPVEPAAPATDLAAVLHHAYDRLRHLTEFRDGLVALPRLYHEALKTLPDLTVEEYHRSLHQLWHGDQVELHVLNEVRTAREPEKAITRNDRLYYFLLWKTP